MFFNLLETTASNICQLNFKLAVMKAKRLTAGLTNSLKQLLRFFSVPPLWVFAMNNQEQFARLFGNTCCSQWSWLALQIQRGYHAICYLFSHHLNSKNNFVLSYKTFKILRHWNCFLSSIATNGNDHAMDTEWNLANVFRFFFCLQKSQKSC